MLLTMCQPYYYLCTERFVLSIPPRLGSYLPQHGGGHDVLLLGRLRGPRSPRPATQVQGVCLYMRRSPVWCSRPAHDFNNLLTLLCVLLVFETQGFCGGRDHLQPRVLRAHPLRGGSGRAAAPDVSAGNVVWCAAYQIKNAMPNMLTIPALYFAVIPALDAN
jgi:hypothetical protein